MERKLKPRNFVAKDLFTPKYRQRVVSPKLVYNRKKLKRNEVYDQNEQKV
jgi:hypothetical protein